MLTYLHIVYGCFHSSCRVKQLQQRLHGLHSLKYLPYGSPQKRFSKLCSKTSGQGKLWLERSWNSVLYVSLFSMCWGIRLRIRVAVFLTILNINRDFGTLAFFYIWEAPSSERTGTLPMSHNYCNGKAGAGMPVFCLLAQGYFYHM